MGAAPADDHVNSFDFDRWRTDPAAFVEDILRDPETGERFVLNWSQRRFLEHAVNRDAQGRLLYPELVYSAPKKSGKTAFAAWLVLYITLMLGGRHAESYCVANDLEQATGRVFAAIRKIVELIPFLRRAAKVTESKITFPETGATITALASDLRRRCGQQRQLRVLR
jgi:phage terminase large subunit-like protein